MPTEPQTTIAFRLADDISPAAFAEILAALDLIHHEMTGEHLRDLRARIGGDP